MSIQKCATAVVENHCYQKPKERKNEITITGVTVCTCKEHKVTAVNCDYYHYDIILFII